MARSEAAWKQKALWNDELEDAYKLALPMRNLYNQDNPGSNKNANVYDSTLMISTFRLANRLQTELFPVLTKWWELEPGPFVLDDERRIQMKKELKVVSDVISAALKNSEFDTAINEMLLEASISVGALRVDRGDDAVNPIRMEAVPTFQLALEAGPYGTVQALYRKHKMRPSMILPTWKASFKKPPGWDQFLNEKEGEDNADSEKVELIEATYAVYNDDGSLKEFHYDVILDGYSAEGSTGPVRIVEREYKRNPWIVLRWMKVANEVQGRGPVLYALPDAKTLNRTIELLLMNASLSVSGVWTAVDDGVMDVDMVSFIPGTVIPVGRNGGSMGPSLMNHSLGANLDLAQLVLEDLRIKIKEIMLDKRLPEETSAVKSATEIVALIRELAQDIGSPFGRIMKELVRPLFQAILDRLHDAGIIQNEIIVDGQNTEVRLLSAMAAGQDLRDVENMTRTLEILEPLGLEAMALGIKIEDLPQWVGEKLGVDINMLRTPQEREQMQQIVGEQLAASAQATGQESFQGANNGS